MIQLAYILHSIHADNLLEQHMSSNYRFFTEYLTMAEIILAMLIANLLC